MSPGRLRRRHPGAPRGPGCRATSPPSTGGPGPRAARASPAGSSTPCRVPGWSGNFGQTNYAPAKAAIASLTQTLSSSCTSSASRSTPSVRPAATRITGTMPNAPDGDRARRRARGRVEPHGPGGVVAAGRLAGLRREPARHRPGHPGGRRGHHPDAGLDRRPHDQQRGEALGRHQARDAAGHRRLQDAGAWSADRPRRGVR